MIQGFVLYVLVSVAIHLNRIILDPSWYIVIALVYIPW
jgi:hypothetical protein